MNWDTGSFLIGFALACVIVPYLIHLGEKYKDVVMPYFEGKK
jgi:hypothetical protein